MLFQKKDKRPYSRFEDEAYVTTFFQEAAALHEERGLIPPRPLAPPMQIGRGATSNLARYNIVAHRYSESEVEKLEEMKATLSPAQASPRQPYSLRSRAT